MTIYYIHPLTGSNANTGLSWAQAWLNLRGLRQQAVVPAPGDEIRIAKSSNIVLTEGAHNYVGVDTPRWYWNGALSVNFSDTLGTNTFREYKPAVPATTTRRNCVPYPPVSGTATHQVPVGPHSYQYLPVPAVSGTGAFNVPNTLLFGGSTNIVYYEAENCTHITGYLRCHVPYSGTGDVDFPAGALAVSLYSGASLVATAPIVTAIRNSATEWTPFVATFAAPLPAITIDGLWLARTAVTVARDNRSFGMELGETIIHRPNNLEDANVVILCGRTSYVSGRNEDIVAPNDIRVVGECLNLSSASGSQGFTSTIGADYNGRVQTAIATYLQAFAAPGIAWTGSTLHSPAGAKGMFDLNGSTGGTALDPVRITGGWNTATDTVDGLTVFSAGLAHAYGSSFAFLDLNGTDHVKVENVAACYGFSSFITRAKNVHLLKCHLPFSFTSAFGEATTDTNVTLEGMYIGPITMESLGTFGDFTLKDVYSHGMGHTLADARFECGNFNMTNSHIGRVRYLTGAQKTYYVRGNATLRDCSLAWPPTLVSVRFGNVLSFAQHKPFSGAQQVFLIKTAPESRWDHIFYEDTSMPTYTFSTQQPTGATCDAKVSIQGFAVLNTESATVAHYPTALRGNHVNGVYGDGITTFTAALNLATGPNSPTGHQYNHSAQLTDTVSHTALTSLQNRGDVSSPPWAYTAARGTPNIQEVNTDPDLAASGRIYIARKFENVTYRSEDTVYLVAMRQGSLRIGPQRVTLKAIYCPKAGLYRAHFGFMGENLQWDNVGYLHILQPLRVVTGIPMPMDGRKIGAVSVFSGPLVGHVVEVPYYAATPAEGLAGGGNRDFNQWRDMYLDFELSAGGLVELRLTSTDFGNFEMSIFDTLTIHERT